MKTIEVVGGIIRRGEKYLLGKRPLGKSQGGHWEFIGGKIEPGETPEQALARECMEEISLPIINAHVRTSVTHSYPDHTIHLTLIDCEPAAGSEPTALEHLELGWFTSSDMRCRDFCAADAELLPVVFGIRKETSMTETYPIEFALRVPIIEKDGAHWLVDTGCPYSHPRVQLPQNAMDRHENPGLRILGLDLFRRYTKIDYANRKITFSDNPIPLDGKTVGLKCDGLGRWMVPMTVDGRAHDYYIDTGAAYSYVHGLSTTRPPAARIEDSGMHGAAWVAAVRRAPATFEGHDFDILCADARENHEGVPPEGVIGYEFFTNFTVVVDRVDKTLTYRKETV